MNRFQQTLYRWSYHRRSYFCFNIQKVTDIHAHFLCIWVSDSEIHYLLTFEISLTTFLTAPMDILFAGLPIWTQQSITTWIIFCWIWGIEFIIDAKGTFLRQDRTTYNKTMWQYTGTRFGMFLFFDYRAYNLTIKHHNLRFISSKLFFHRLNPDWNTVIDL